MLHSLSGLCVLDAGGRVLKANTAWIALTGLTESNPIGQHFRELFLDSNCALRRSYDEVCAGKTIALPVKLVQRTGRDAWIETSIAPLPFPDGMGVLITCLDVTARQLAAESLRTISESGRRFAIAFEASPMAKVLVRNVDRRVIEVNQAYLHLFGLRREEVLDQVASSLPIIADPDEYEQFWAKVAKLHRAAEFDFTFQSPGAPVRDAVASAEQISLGDQDFLLIVVQDVTDRRAAERALRESDERFRQLADTIQEVFWLSDPAKHKIVYISPAYERIWGRPCEVLYNDSRDWAAAIHPDDRQRVVDAALTRQVTGEYDEEYRIVRPDGALRWIRDQAFPVRDALGGVIRVAGIARDVTDRRLLGEQLRQTQRLESIGLLAGGIAHDFNNWLTVISGNTDLLRDMFPESSEEAELLGEIHHAGERASSLTRQLLAFSRLEVIEVRVVDLHSVIVDTEKMLRRVLGEDVLLATALAPQPAFVEIDPGSWVQVLMNLAVNARDAMPRGGRLTIESRIETHDEDFVRAHPGVPLGRNVVLSVTDSGTGMPPEVRSRIFEPFFTTKSIGHGTGLGLAVVHGIVSQAGGHIELESEPGVGTSFHFYIPMAKRLESRADAQAPGADQGGHETILLVEDEASIRRFAVRALKSRGYTILEAGDGQEALAVLQGHPGPIDLLLTDVVMPRMDGLELAEALRPRFPGLAVLYTSGYTDDAVLRHGIQQAEVAFLSKPYTPTDLRRKVREVLDRE